MNAVGWWNRGEGLQPAWTRLAMRRACDALGGQAAFACASCSRISGVKLLPIETSQVAPSSAHGLRDSSSLATCSSLRARSVQDLEQASRVCSVLSGHVSHACRSGPVAACTPQLCAVCWLMPVVVRSWLAHVSKLVCLQVRSLSERSSQLFLGDLRAARQC